MKRLTSVFLLLAFSTCFHSEVVARTTTLTGGITVGYQFVERKDETLQTGNDTGSTESSSTSNNVQKGQKISATPVMTFTNESAKDSIEIQYKPRFFYDWELEKNDIDHNVNVNVNRKLTNRWYIQGSDYLITADHQDALASQNNNENNLTDTAITNENDDSSKKYDSRRYWRNELSFLTKYLYHNDSNIVLTYDYKLLRNEKTEDENDRFRDFDVHNTSLSCSYRFNKQWKVKALGQYGQGDYYPTNQTTADTSETTSEANATADTLDDRLVFLETIKGSLVVYAQIWPHSPLFMKYNYYSYDYDAYKRDDMVLQEFIVGGSTTISSDLKVSISGGATLVDPEKRERSWGYNGRVMVTYLFKSGSLEVTFNKGYAKDMFSSVSEETIDDIASISAALTIQPQKHLSFIFFGSYKDNQKEKITIPDEQLSSTTDSTENGGLDPEKYYERQYSLGVKVNYLFNKENTATLGYQYTDFDSELEGDDYSESLFFITFGIQKELFRW